MIKVNSSDTKQDTQDIWYVDICVYICGWFFWIYYNFFRIL